MTHPPHSHIDPMNDRLNCSARDHGFLGSSHGRNEGRTWAVILLTIITMVAEIWAGHSFGSMALVADGWHMATHAGALLITAAAYAFARRHAKNPRFSFGTGKVGDLGAFASAVALGIAALLIGWESVERLITPIPIAFDQAILVAVIGLVVNLASAVLLHQGHHGHGHHDHAHHDHGHHDHGHHHGHHHESHAPHQDLNLRSAYLHVVADALTSVLAILALLAGSALGWAWMDAAVGLLGGVVIARWSLGLMRDAGANLLDAVPDRGLARTIQTRLEVDETQVTDLHLWRLGPGHLAAVVHLSAPAPHEPIWYKQRLADLTALSHITVEVARR